MLFDIRFFILTRYLFPTPPVKYTILQLCSIYTDLPRSEHPLIWYDLFLLAEILLIK